MSFPEPDQSGKTPYAWTSEIRRQATIAVHIAAADGDLRVLGYMVRAAIAHGLTTDDVCRAGNLSPEHVQQLSDPGSVAA